MPEKRMAFAELSKTDFNICSVAAVSRRWDFYNKNNYLESGRDENILSFTLHGGKNIYVRGSEKPVFTITEPSAIFIGEGAPYLSETLPEEGETSGQTICVRFRLADENGNVIIIDDSPICFTDDKAHTLRRFFEQIFSCYIKPNYTAPELKSLCYSLICRLLAINEEESRTGEFANLMPAVNAIKENPAADIPVAELARMCWLSESHFRARFKQYTGGLSPADYRNKLRIDKAEELLASSLWTTDLIAETLGFYDTSHFYKIYKKFTGKTPKHSLRSAEAKLP